MCTEIRNHVCSAYIPTHPHLHLHTSTPALTQCTYTYTYSLTSSHMHTLTQCTHMHPDACIYSLTPSHMHTLTPSQDGESVMVKAATGGGDSSEQLPIVFTVPKFLPNELDHECAKYTGVCNKPEAHVGIRESLVLCG